MRHHEDTPIARGPRAGLLALVLGALAALPAAARAQDGSDAALDALIKEIGDDAKADARPEEPKKPEEPAKAEDSKKPAKAEEPKKPASNPEELSDKDKELDDLLQSLGETKDEPDAKDERKPPGRPDDGDQNQGPGGQGDEEKKDQGPGGGRDRQPRLDEKDRAIDEELEELTGRRRKKKDQGDGQGSGPMGEIIKEMRDIEKRLGEPDTGEETRGRQQQLVKRLDTLIEQIRKEQQQQQGGRIQQQTRQQGDKPGDQEGQQAGNNPGGAPNQLPKKPTDRRSLAGGKDAWGHLPPELRQEMENVAKEESLPISEDLIRRYYLSVSRGKLNRGE